MYKVWSRGCWSQDHQNQGQDRQVNTCDRASQQISKAVAKCRRNHRGTSYYGQQYRWRSYPGVNCESKFKKATRTRGQERSWSSAQTSSACMHVISVQSRNQGLSARSGVGSCMARVMQSYSVAESIVRVNVGLRGSGWFGLVACRLASLLLLGHSVIPEGDICFVPTI